MTCLVAGDQTLRTEGTRLRTPHNLSQTNKCKQSKHNSKENENKVFDKLRKEPIKGFVKQKKTNELKAFGGISSDKANLWF